MEIIMKWFVTKICNKDLINNNKENGLLFVITRLLQRNGRKENNLIFLQLLMRD